MKTKQDVNAKTLRLFWSISARYPLRFALVIVLPITTVTVASFVGPYIIATFFNKLQSGQTIVISQTAPLIVAYLFTQLYGEVIGWRLALYCVWTLETQGQKDLVTKLFRHLTAQSLSFHSNRFGGSLVSQVSKIFSAYERFTDSIVFQVIPVITSIVAAIAILGHLFWQYALALLVVSTAFLLFVLYGTRKMAALSTAESQASTASTGRLADTITNIAAVKSYAREDDELAAYVDTIDTWRKHSLATMRGFLGVSTGYSSMIMVLNSLALVTALIATEHHLIAAGTVYLAITYTFTVARQLWETNQIGRNYNRVMGDAYDMVQILDLAPEINDPAEPEAPKILRGSITFTNVTFGHDGTKKPLFNHLNVHIKPGEKVGLVGHSGSGKTTLTRLLLRFSDIRSGAITIDGQDIRNITQADLRQHIAYVPQEPLLFHRSIAENIAYGEPNASQEAIEAAAKMASAHDFIISLPDGYETLVGERGVKLSGGQRQRIAIARAMLKNAPILALDEATSALDSESEVLIQAALWKLMEGRTAIVIAHRLSTIQKMDRIIVLDKGKIVEEGSHKELISKPNGTYAKLWAHQSGGFIEE